MLEGAKPLLSASTSWGNDDEDDPDQVKKLQTATQDISSIFWESDSGEPLNINQIFRVASRLAVRDAHSSGRVDPTTLMHIFTALLCQPLGLGDYVSSEHQPSIDTAALVRAAQEAIPPPTPHSGFSDTTGYSSLPLKLSDVDKELVRTRKYHSPSERFNLTTP